MPNLGFFASAGFPFTRMADLSGTAVVLPDRPNAVETQAYLDLVGQLAAITGLPATGIEVVGPGALASVAARTLLVLGTLSRQPALNQLLRETPVRQEGGGLRDATRQFEAALAANPSDADALGGLGVARLREGRSAEARTLLERAIAANPASAGQWQPALDEADSILRSAGRRQVADRTDAETLLGELALRRGDAPAAEQRFRTALTRRPGFPPAQQGLIQALRAQSRLAEAPVRAPRVTDVPEVPAATPGEAGRLRAEAARSSDPGVAAALLRQASQQAPEDPWLRLDLARALRRQRNTPEGRALVEELAARTGRRDDIYAAALLADEDGRAADSEAWLGRIPTGRRTWRG